MSSAENTIEPGRDGRESNWDAYIHMLKASIQGRMEYRGSFFMYIFTVIGFYAAQIAVIGLMLNRFKSIGAWSAGEIAFLYALLVIAQGMVSMTCSGLLNFSEFIREGTFDRILLRPLGSLAQILMMRFDPAGLAHFVLGIAALLTANALVQPNWTLLSASMLLVTVIGGALILASVRIVIAAAAFFTVSNQGLQHLVVFSSREFLLYPVDIYVKPVRFLLTFLFPLAFVNFYPAHYFLDKDAAGLFHPYFIYLTLPVGVLALVPALMFWNYAVNRYSSTGN